MKTTFAPTRPSKRGFTLVELLVVIVIIAILASLAVPVTNKVMEMANNMRIKSVMKDLQVSIGHFRTEYNRFPADLTASRRLIQSHLSARQPQLALRVYESLDPQKLTSADLHQRDLISQL